MGRILSAYGHEGLTVTSGAVVTFTVGTYMTTTYHPKGAFVTVETNDVRFTVDGTTPTSTVGHLLSDKDTVELWGQDVQNFKVIAPGSNATIHVSYYGEGARLA